MDEAQATSFSHPSQNPDLSSIKTFWTEMKLELNRSPASSLWDLKVKLRSIWSSIDEDLVRKTVRSMHKRLDAVKEARGGHTNGLV
ncbi:uncharacterized protein PITG_01841 [Phytophthora infestans T30-4]|uniref:Uncharacterized protein n=1 Tax=Phytophthora infestans (strain T30-4) TaxID=403677 RepID=D0MU80_PHYIT|nr:uncharacterized protein PITG_01841 [Phytophthora infestans T30-4]EEY61527.1 conserved hypothetical protein [Phytophthora infestans T30-4]|eukprot:XP_002908444.1 conserved hypothetical protein [Phytophthora infestans T30-4]